MTAVLGALRDLFLDPPAVAARPRPTALGRAAQRAVPVDVAVLCAPDTAAAAGAVVALAAMRRTRAAAGVVARWHPQASSATAEGAPATLAARRLARRLQDRDVAAVARGRLVDVALPVDPSDAAVAVARLVGAVDVPLVTVIAGPRPEALDTVLRARDRVVVVAPPAAPDGMVELATVEASRMARATGRLDLPASIGVKLAARCGLVLPSSARAAADRALDGRHG